MLRKTRLAPMSKKRRKESRRYTALRVEFMAKHRHCEVCVPGVCRNTAQDVHHVEGRGINLNAVESWVAVCRPCHDYIHAHGSWARENGYLAK